MAIPHPRLRGVHEKIRRAKKHRADLAAVLLAHRETRPISIGVQRNAERRLVYYVNAVAPVPPDVTLITGDALHCLRSSLDHMAWQLVESAGNVPGKATAFPIADTSQKFADAIGGCTKGMAPPAVSAIRGLHPYQGGNDSLWLLSRLDNVDKHRLLITTGQAYRSVDIGRVMFRKLLEGVSESSDERLRSLADVAIPSQFYRPADRLFPLKIGDELFVDAVDAEEDPGLQFLFEVSFGEAGVVDGAQITDTFDEILTAIEQAIEALTPHLT